MPDKRLEIVQTLDRDLELTLRGAAAAGPVHLSAGACALPRRALDARLERAVAAALQTQLDIHRRLLQRARQRQIADRPLCQVPHPELQVQRTHWRAAERELPVDIGAGGEVRRLAGDLAVPVGDARQARGERAQVDERGPPGETE